MAKGGCLFFFRAKWRVSNKPPSKKEGVQFTLTKSKLDFSINMVFLGDRKLLCPFYLETLVFLVKIVYKSAKHGIINL
jgi:hypothetical protein